ncbi:sulfatase-like hydrolase/transferase [Maribacter sp. 2210JD10-5]|uniref:sulfatase-like hydrolase/transferase n=1 Tax=Maribacter sp. 2210JD10-5 TaxID=3386272 RepID=UPI0039BD8E9F
MISNLKFILACILLVITTSTLAQKPERVIVYMIDGLHWKAPSKLKMPNFNQLKKQGTFIEQSYMITPHHPTVGDYGKMHTSSFPNPVLQSGTLFIGKDDKFLQEMFSPEHPTAFVANTPAYQSVSRGFTTIVSDGGMSDTEVVEKSISILKDKDQKYMRIHLQSAGNQGRYLSYTTPDKPYFRNIWGKDSPYIKAVEEADQLLGELVDYLKKAGKWESTLLIVSSDQGQAEIGWHPMITEDSWRTPMVFVGPGIAKGRTLPYFEHTDLTPTIAHLMQVETPTKNGGTGKAIKAVLASEKASEFKHPKYIKTINQQINDFNSLRSKIMLAAEQDPYYSSLITFLENELLTPKPFYHQDRFLEWKRAGSTEHLIEVNDGILKQMREELEGASKEYVVPERN